MTLTEKRNKRRLDMHKYYWMHLERMRLYNNWYAKIKRAKIKGLPVEDLIKARDAELKAEQKI